MLEQFHPVAIHELSTYAKGNGFTGVQRGLGLRRVDQYAGLRAFQRPGGGGCCFVGHGGAALDRHDSSKLGV